MTLNEYQTSAHTTAQYPEIFVGAKDNGEHLNKCNIMYPALGLAGEAGEFAEKIKKIVRNNGGHISQDNIIELQKELGDILWYIAESATQLNLSLSAIAKVNLKKLDSRSKRGVLLSEGDNR